MSNIPNIAIIILAAGESYRMGTPKQLLKWNKTTLLGHAINTAEATNKIKTIVVLGANCELIKPKIKIHQVDIIENTNWDFGLGKSIAYGIAHIIKEDSNYDGALIMLADQPLIDSKYLNSMIAQFKTGKGQIVATAYNNGKQGVPVLFDKAYFQELSQLNDDKGAKSVLQKHSKYVSIINAEHDVSDIDTLEGYESLYKTNH